MKIGIIGLGNIGRAYTEELIKYAINYNSTSLGKNNPLNEIVIWNRTTNKTQSFIDLCESGQIPDSYSDAQNDYPQDAFLQEQARNKAMENIVGFEISNTEFDSNKDLIKLTTSKDFEGFEDTDIVFVSAGRAREKGMTRNDLIEANRPIVEAFTKSVPEKAILINVTNPADEITQLICEIRIKNGLNKDLARKRTLGMTGLLDSARLAFLIASNFNVDIDTLSGAKVVGFHNDKMIALFNKVKINDKPVSDEKLKLHKNKIEDELPKQGSEVIKQTGTSAYLTPAHASMLMTKAIVEDIGVELTASSFYKNLFVGVPIKLDKNGASILPTDKWDISDKELSKLEDSLKS